MSLFLAGSFCLLKVVFLSLPILCVAQESDLEKLTQRLQAFGQNIPQEKVFVHMDNTCYFQGDTIWFTAYTRQTNTDKPSVVSGVLYVELLNHDGYLVERKLIEMNNGRGHGFFALNNTIQYSGFYELRAYTRWQLNWGEHEHKHYKSAAYLFRDAQREREYYRDYDKLYSRVFPVYDKPQVKGDYTRDMTLRMLRREFKNDVDAPTATLSLFPEGGDLIAGVPCRVAFEAAMSDGEQLDGTLSLGNIKAETVNRGRGVFTIVPQDGVTQEATFTLAKDHSSVNVKLPKAKQTGVSVRLEQMNDLWQASLYKTPNLSADGLALSLMHEGRLVDWRKFSDLSADGNGFRYDISETLLSEAGVYQITVFDTQGRVFADRLFFVRKPMQEVPTLTVSGMKNRYESYAKVELTVSGKAKDTPISIAVRDAKGSDRHFDSGNIMTEMLLSSEIKGFVPDPEWFFEKDDAEHRQALDLLMMTQGWRRFQWRDMAVKGSWELTQPNERTPILTGYVDYNPNRVDPTGDLLLALFDPAKGRMRDVRHLISLGKKKLTESMRIHAEFCHFSSNSYAASEEHIKDNTFRLPLPKFYGESSLSISVADTAKWRKKNGKKRAYSWTQLADYGELLNQSLKDVEEADYRAYVVWPYPRFVKPYNFYQIHMQSMADDSDFDIPEELLADNSTLMNSVTVKARRRSRLKGFNSSYPVLMLDGYEAWNAIEDAGIPITFHGVVRKELVYAFLNNYGAPEDADGNKIDRIEICFPQHLNKGGKIPRDSIYHPKYLDAVRKAQDATSEERRMLIGDLLAGADPRVDIDRYVVYSDYQPRLEGSSRYRGTDRPETMIVIYPFYGDTLRAVYRDRYYILPGLAMPAEFYSPDYGKQTPPKPIDYRRTLYWNPDLQLDANGEAKVTFYNNARTTTLSIEAEGQAADGVLLWGKWGADRSAPPVPETSHAGSAAETAAIRHHTVSHCHS